MKKILVMLLLMSGFAGTLLVQNVFADEEVISVGDVWRYFKGTEAPPANWHDLSFDDTAWLEGPTGIGYSTDIQYATDISDMEGNYWSVFARRKFSVADPDAPSALKLGIRYDDGFIAYVNGTEIARSNNMVDPVNYDTLATFSHDEEDAEEFFTFMISSGLLQPGNNVLAIEFHNVSFTSSDAGIIPRLTVIDNMLPEASVQASYPNTGKVPLTVDFDASGSQDPDGNIVEYSWNFGDGTPVEQGPNPLRQHTYTAQGLYVCVLEVKDNKDGTDTDSVTIVVGPPRTIYVDRNMTGSFNGSGDAIGIYNPEKREAGSGSATAYNTIMEASLEATPGDTIVIRGGIYNETLRPQNSGNAAAPITYTNYGDEVVIIRDTPGISNLTPDEVALDQPGRQYGIYMYDVSHVVIEGLQVTNVTGWCRVVQSDHITLKNNKFTMALGYGTTGSIKFYHSDYNKILNNTIHDGNDNLMLIHSDRNLVEGNHIMMGRHTLWCIRAGNFNMIRDNYFHNEIQKIGEVYDVEAAKDTPIMYDAAHYNIIERNIFAKTASSGDSSPFAGIQYAGQHGIIRKNLFYETIGPALDFTLYSDEARYNYKNRAYNNVFYKTDFAGISLSGSQSYTFYDNIMKNNILLQSIFVANDTRWSWYTGELAGKPVQLMTGRIDGFVFENNNLFNQQAGELYLITYGSRGSSSNPPQHEVSWWENNHPNLFRNNLEHNPLFVDPVNHDYHLTEESPMIDAGAYLSVTRGSGSGTSMPVEDVGYFYDGYDIEGEAGDIIQLEGQITRARITAINYDTNTLTLNRSLTWTAGQGMSLAYSGNAPDIGAYEYGASSPSNKLPIANAGPNQTVTDSGRNGSEQVTLDGSGSLDPDGTIVSFVWTEGATQIATGVKPTVTLSLGTHLITLTVTDNGGLTNTDTVTIKVLKEGERFGELPAGCYNNVFNPSKGEEAIIVVEIKEQGYIKIDLYDTRGNKIKELADEEKNGGTYPYHWNGMDDSGNLVGSGLYFVHIQAGDYKKTKKIVVVK